MPIPAPKISFENAWPWFFSFRTSSSTSFHRLINQKNPKVTVVELQVPKSTVKHCFHKLFKDIAGKEHLLRASHRNAASTKHIQCVFVQVCTGYSTMLPHRNNQLCHYNSQLSETVLMIENLLWLNFSKSGLPYVGLYTMSSILSPWCWRYQYFRLYVESFGVWGVYCGW